MVIELSDIIELIRIVVWPIVFSIFLILYRKTISNFIQEAGSRISKLSIFQFSLELNKVPEFLTSVSYGQSLTDLAELTNSPYIIDSSNENLYSILALPQTGSNFITFDFGTGKKWLTSRLLLFTYLLEKMRGLRCVAFLETKEHINRRFIGTAKPENIRFALTRKYPWLKEALEKTLVAVQTDSTMPLEISQAINIAWSYIPKLQHIGHTPPDNEKEFIKFENQQIWERAQWLDSALIKNILDNYLDESYVYDSPEISQEKLIKSILQNEGSYIALVDKKEIFKRIIDRSSLVDSIIKRISE